VLHAHRRIAVVSAPRPNRLTVIVPTYRGSRHLRATLDSLADQTVPLAEVIVVDDGSDDDTVALAREHPLAPTVVVQDHAGVAVARNRGAHRATTPYVAFLDQDDLWLPERHERLLAFLDRRPGVSALVTTERTFWLEQDREALAQAGELLHRFADFPACASDADALAASSAALVATEVTDAVTIRELLAGTVTVTTSYVFDRETFVAAGGCVTFARSMDDYLALVDLARITQVVRLDEPSVLYRLHPGATTLSTTWPWHLLTGLAAVRFGGNLVPIDHARDRAHVVPLDDERQFAMHQLLALAGNGRAGDLLDALALIRLLGCDGPDRRRAGARVARRWLRGAASRGRRRLG
jgi:hypothetical protein